MGAALITCPIVYWLSHNIVSCVIYLSPYKKWNNIISVVQHINLVCITSIILTWWHLTIYNLYWLLTQIQMPSPRQYYLFLLVIKSNISCIERSWPDRGGKGKTNAPRFQGKSFAPNGWLTVDSPSQCFNERLAQSFTCSALPKFPMFKDKRKLKSKYLFMY